MVLALRKCGTTLSKVVQCKNAVAGHARGGVFTTSSNQRSNHARTRLKPYVEQWTSPWTASETSQQQITAAGKINQNIMLLARRTDPGNFSSFAVCIETNNTELTSSGQR